MPLSRLTHLPLLGVVSVAVAVGFAGGGESAAPGSAGSAAPPELDVAAVIDESLGQAASRDLRRRQPELAALYGARQNRPIWSEGERLVPAAESLVAAIEQSAERGLDPNRYPVEKLRRRLLSCGSAGRAHPSVRRRQLAECDLLLSRTFLEFSRDLSVGRVSARSAGIAWFTKPRSIDAAPRLLEAVSADDVARTLDGFEPLHPGYVALKEALAALRALEAQGGWPELPTSAKRFAADPLGPAKLRSRLEASGDLENATAPGDADLGAALKRFQANHGLPASGEVDNATLAALNVPVEARRRQVELNLERWRWLPESFGERYILVNVPAYELELVELGALRLRMRVVVGKPYQQTPAFSDVVENLELNPFWNVPPSIFEQEIAPAMRKNPDYLASEDMEIVIVGEQGEALQVRQRPGPKNALGRIKFVLPNEYNIYLHDTPAGDLFGRNTRSFSHGCIRLERPLDLAELLLAPEREWNRQRLEDEIATGENRFVRLSEPVPVHILYWTAWVDAAGTLQFRADPYDIDTKLERALRDRKIS